ncbi:MAG TPA: ATP-dependent 6-phosphofructokinase [Polyangiaceae bacterium LLY-WYZ-14_1]|nr:ATP-dependent 6-phosphofructokinase [Polyangiaceae bacterium LLY-WYZ-14_1]
MGKRVAIITGGGDCPGLNAVIRAAVTVGARTHGFECLGVEDALMGLVDLEYRRPHGNQWLTPQSVRGILGKGGTILGTSNRSDPFRYVNPETGITEAAETDVSDAVMENFRQLSLDALISIGGDGSMRIAKRFLDKGMPVVGVPKTIDNDLGATDVTFGFDTAVQTATEALDRVRDTAESHDRVMLVEVMGRDAGHIALHAGVAGGADAILIPEIPYRVEPLAEMVRRKAAEGQTHAVICVAEGAKPDGGEASAQAAKPGEMRRLIGCAHRVGEALQPLIDNDLRVTVLGHLQRGGTPTSRDRVLATRFGRAAANLVAAEDFGKMVALRGREVVAIDIEEAVAEAKLVDPAGELVQTARDLGVAFGD